MTRFRMSFVDSRDVPHAYIAALEKPEVAWLAVYFGPALRSPEHYGGDEREIVVLC